VVPATATGCRHCSSVTSRSSASSLSTSAANGATAGGSTSGSGYPAGRRATAAASILLRDPLVRHLAAYPVHRPAVGDHPEPGPQAAALRVEPRRVHPYLDEHLLGDVLHAGPVAGHPQCQPVHQRREPVVQLGQRRLLPGEPVAPLAV
jgi:hypothetical protein